MPADPYIWNPTLRWDTPAGRTLDELIKVLPLGLSPLITIFGSAPIQMGVESRLLSADVDVFSDADLARVVEEHHFGKGERDVYVQVCDPLNFRTSPKWISRAFVTTRGPCSLRFPHPFDILIAKLHRVAEKDLEAFKAVIQKTAHPTEEELIRELQDAVDLFRPGFDEENATDLVTNTRILWRHIFGHDINPREKIIAPALERRRKGYGEPETDLKNELREAAGAPVPKRKRAKK